MTDIAPTAENDPHQHIGVFQVTFEFLARVLDLAPNQIAAIGVDMNLGEMSVTLIGPDMPVFEPGTFLRRVSITYRKAEDGAIVKDVSWLGKGD